jgi:hypothetical protein
MRHSKRHSSFTLMPSDGLNTTDEFATSISANGYKRTPWRVGQHVCFTPRSRHPNTDVGFSKNNVGFSLNSRRNQGIGFSSAPDPTETSLQFSDCGSIVSHSTGFPDALS